VIVSGAPNAVGRGETTESGKSEDMAAVVETPGRPEAPKTRGTVPAKHIAAVVVGNALEFYDFLNYSFFAVYIGRAFFPSTSPTASLLASLGTFGVGFVTRPIGGFVIGRMGDRVGRKPAMILSFSLMGFAIIGLALTPSHARIGVAAPILVILFRMVQGFALGGEVGPTTAFLLESAPAERRGFYTAFQFWTQDLSVMVAGLVGFALSSLLNEQQLQDFGWRISFLLGAVIVPFGLWMRRGLPETFHAGDAAKAETIVSRKYMWIAFLGLLILASGTIGNYTAEYMTTYAIATLHMHANVAFGATIAIGLTGVLLELPAGALSDRFGRKPMMLLFGTLLLIAIYPAYYLIDRFQTPAALFSATAVMFALLVLCNGPSIIWLTESLPPSIRSGALSIVYALSIAAFGGTAQYAVTWLIRATGSPLVPAWYWIVATVVGLAAMMLTHESAPRALAKRSRRSEPL
jgi:MFS transporter, MHS family, citrate/tricarballylate:H+ symporter